jgi:hypothetical protein
VHTDYKESLSRVFERVFEVQDRIASLHPCLAYPYPIAVADGHALDVYRPDSSVRRYDLTARVQVPMVLPDRIRAAFPLDNLDGMMACVVTGDAFSTIDGYVEIFHEFVHCYQFEQCENDLKQSLGVAVKAKAANDFMWELNYAFPYEDPRVRYAYSALLESLKEWLKGADNGADTCANTCPNTGANAGEQGDAVGEQRTSSSRVSQGGRIYESISESRRLLREALDDHSFEYMVWQEWKEGFARYIENRIRTCLGLPVNLGGDHIDDSSPFTRVSFYAGGAALIELLEGLRPEAVRDLRLLFAELMAIGAGN